MPVSQGACLINRFERLPAAHRQPATTTIVELTGERRATPAWMSAVTSDAHGDQGHLSSRSQQTCAPHRRDRH